MSEGTICLVGAGNMGGAMLGGWLEAGRNPASITVLDPDPPEPYAKLMAEHGVAFQVVPGITAASGCAAYSGIPLTHRDYAQSCVFVAGHLKDGTVDLNWKALAHPQQTVVFYMGLVGLPIIAEQLIAHGLPGDTPAALVQQGTTQEQRVITATLANLAEAVERAQPRPPTLLIVGKVVELQEKLGWYRTGADGRVHDLIRPIH